MNLLRLLYVCVGLLSFWPDLLAQPRWEATYSQGKIIQINPVYPDRPQPARIGQVGLRWQTQGKKAWQERHNFPEIGLSLLAGDLGNGPVLGQIVSLIPSLHGSLATWKGLALEYGLATSLAYLNRPFDRQTNPTNNAIGSHFGNLSFFQLGLSHRLAGKWEGFAGGNFFHLSNANTRVPNLGINFPTFQLGLRYGLKQPPPARLSSPPPPGKIRPGLRLGRGFAGHIAAAGPSYPSYLFSPYLLLDWRNKIRWKLGIEGFFHGPTNDFLRNHGVDWLSPREESLGLIAFGGAEFLLGRLAIVAQLGPYLRRPLLLDYRLYTKMGIQLYLHDQQIDKGPQPYLGAYVHAHSGEADFGELAIGWVF
jgi:hypothetical protein